MIQRLALWLNHPDNVDLVLILTTLPLVLFLVVGTLAHWDLTTAWSRP